jgi:hypothetical protein
MRRAFQPLPSASPARSREEDTFAQGGWVAELSARVVEHVLSRDRLAELLVIIRSFAR